jgi:glycosyltransferase involved in cell wall biosynthesis
VDSRYIVAVETFAMNKITNSALSCHAWKHLKQIEIADILVGIPSYNNAHTINYVVYQVAKGLETYFPNLKTLIFISDGNSTDGTLATIEAMRLPFQVDLFSATYKGVSGKGSAVKAIFEAASFLGVKSVALVDSDLRSITPDWIRMLISPTLSGTGLVTPYYVRHKYDGTITNFLCYPTTASLYGKEIRQPIGGDFGLSIELIKNLLESPLWQTPYVPRFGIDIFETHTALAKKFKIKQAFLGTKVHEAKDPGKHLGSMFRQVVGSMFACIESYAKVWKEIQDQEKVEVICEERFALTPEEVHVNLKNLIRMFKVGFKENRQIYRTVLSDNLLNEIEELGKMGEIETTFSPESWAKTVFSFVAGFGKEGQLKRDRLLDALRIMWIGKVASFIKETLELDTVKAEKKIEEEVSAFKKFKPYLLDLFE